MWWPAVSDYVSSAGTLGVFLVATPLAAMLYGTTVLQSMQFYDRFYNDPRVLKLLVFVLWIFETVTMLMEIHALYTYAVVNGGVQFAVAPVPASLVFERAFCFAAIYAVQMFFAFRIGQLGKRNWFLQAIICALATGAIATGLAATVETSNYEVNDPAHPKFVDILSSVSAGLQIVTDALITLSLYWLNRNRIGSQHTFWKRTFLSSVNRGVFSLVLQILTTLTYFVLRPRLVWLAFHMASSKVHAISMLSTLNTRTTRDGVGCDAEIIDAKLRYRVNRELGGANAFATRPDTPPNLPVPNITYGLPRSPSSWFTANKSSEGVESWTPSYHARSTTAVDGADSVVG